VASADERPALAWDFVRANFEALAGKQSPFFRNTVCWSFSFTSMIESFVPIGGQRHNNEAE